MRKNILLLISGLILLFSIIGFSGCSSEPDDEFAIYYTKNDIPPNQMAAMSYVEPADEPVISEEDIISYDAGTHEIKLTEEGFERIEGILPPTSGRSFIVCLNGSPVYGGAFWAHYSSQSYDGIVIMAPLVSEERTIQISLGYPSAGFYTWDDPRNDPSIMKALDTSGKLINTSAATFMEELPHSMKGWELFSWQENGDWQFRLMIGTNRNKTYEEIINGAEYPDEWMSIRVTGDESVKSLLGKLPDGDFLTWFGEGTIVTDKTGGPRIELPDKITIDRIRNYAEYCGIEFSVPDTD